MINELKGILAKLDVALLNKNEPEEVYLSYIDSYLVDLEKWQKLYADVLTRPNVAEIPEFINLGGELKAKHQELMEFTNRVKDVVGEELSGVNSRAKAIRRYIDVLPERVSITKGKKG